MRRYFYFSLWLFATFITSSEVIAAPLTFCFEDVPQKPWTMPNGTGLNIYLLKQVEKQLGEHFILVAKPWRRCQEETRYGVVDGFFATANTDERRAYSAFPTLPNGQPDKTADMYEDRFDVYLRKGGAATWDGKKLESPATPVLAQRGYHVATVLRENGLQVNESIKSAEDGLRMLSDNAADAAVLQGEEGQNLAKSDPRYVNRFVTSSTPYLVIPLYLAIGRKVYDDNPKRIEAIWSAIRQIKDTPQYRAQLTAVGVR